MSVLAAVRSAARVDRLLAADASDWERCEAVQVALVPTPVDAQPSAYVQTSWRDRPRGEVDEVAVRAMVTGDALALHLAWRQEDPRRTIDDHNVYADACAVLFPANGTQAPIATMGSADAPVCGWYWRAGTADPFEIVAHGIGTVDRAKEHAVQCAAAWADGLWQVVLARELGAAAAPDLASVGEIPVAFAIWAGGRGERAGLKSHSPQFVQLRLRA